MRVSRICFIIYPEKRRILVVHFGKKAAVLTAAGVLAATAVTGCSGSINTDAVVATVGDDEITLGVANFYARMTQGQYETYYASMMGTTGDAMWTQEAGEDQTYEESVKDGLLENLENMYLISQHAADYEVSLTEEEEDAIAEAAAQFDEDNTDEAKETVSGYRKDIEEFLRLATIQTKMDSKMREGVDEEVSDEEAAQKAMQYVFFSYTTTDDSGNTTELTDEEKESLKTDAQSLVDRVNAGEDISTVAEELGQTAYDLTFDSESTSPNEDLIAAVDAFETEGQVTDVIEADDGLYVGRLTSLLDRDATDQKKTSIVEERRQEQYDSLLEEWRNDTDIKVDEKVWDKVDFEDTGVTIITSETEETTTDDGSTDDTSEGSSESADDSSEDASASEDSASE